MFCPSIPPLSSALKMHLTVQKLYDRDLTARCSRETQQASITRTSELDFIGSVIFNSPITCRCHQFSVTKSNGATDRIGLQGDRQATHISYDVACLHKKICDFQYARTIFFCISHPCVEPYLWLTLCRHYPWNFRSPLVATFQTPTCHLL